MADSDQVTLAPVAGAARIDVIDVLRGFAILGIFFMNIPFMGGRIADIVVDPRSIGWTPLDAASWTVVQVALEGHAARTARAAVRRRADGARPARDDARRAGRGRRPLYLRRNLWLLGFGLFDVFILLWAGDILHIYALAALFLFPFRKLGPRLLLAIGLVFALYTLATGAQRYIERTDLMARAVAAQKHQAARTPLTAADKKALDEWKKAVEGRTLGGPEIRAYRAQEEKGHAGGFIAYAQLNIGTWLFFVQESLPQNILEGILHDADRHRAVEMARDPGRAERALLSAADARLLSARNGAALDRRAGNAGDGGRSRAASG